MSTVAAKRAKAKYRANNKEKLAAANKARRAKLTPQQRREISAYGIKRAKKVAAVTRSFINAVKLQPCADCGNIYLPVCMDFDHVRGIKRTDVSKLINFGWKHVLAEITKCEVVCSNCHRIRTHLRKLNLPC